MPDKTDEPGNFAQACFVASAVIVAFGYFFRADIVDVVNIWYFVKVAILATSVSALGAGADWLDKRRVQRLRDKKAAGILAEVRDSHLSGEDAGYGLYLRPFFSTGKLGVEAHTKRPLMPILPSYHEARAAEKAVDIEATLTKALEPLGALIALGKPGEQIGVGRVRSDESKWKEDVTLLAHHARYIVVVPSERPGTSWELDLVRRDALLPKCVFVMPPELYIDTLDLEATWRRASIAAAESGILLPDYDSGGLLFSIGSDGHVRAAQPLDLSDHAGICASFRSIRWV